MASDGSAAVPLAIMPDVKVAVVPETVTKLAVVPVTVVPVMVVKPAVPPVIERPLNAVVTLIF